MSSNKTSISDPFSQPPRQTHNIIRVLVYMPSLIWLTLGVGFAIISRICVTIIASRRGPPRRRDRAETCHLAVFLGSGKLDTICHNYAQTTWLFRWPQQRGPVTCFCTGFLALFPEDVSGKRRGFTQRAKGHRIGTS